MCRFKNKKPVLPYMIPHRQTVSDNVWTVGKINEASGVDSLTHFFLYPAFEQAYTRHILTEGSPYQECTTVPTFNFCTTKCVGSPGRIRDRTPDCHLNSWAWMTSQLKVAMSRKLRGPSMCFAYICDMISMGVSTTRHGQTSSRLVQELSIRTVHVSITK